MSTGPTRTSTPRAGAGEERIAAAFRDHEGAAALMPYIMGGYPDPSVSRDIAKAFGTWDAVKEAIDAATAARPGPNYRRLIGLKGLGPKSAETLMQVLGSGQARGGDLFEQGPPTIAMAIAGIKGVRSSAAEALAAAFPDVRSFIETARAGAKEMPGDAYRELASLQGIGEVAADALIDFFHEAHNREAVEALQRDATSMARAPRR